MEWFYELLLRAFSASMRRRWGADMHQLVRDQLAEAHARGESRAKLVCLLAWDAMRHGLGERLSPWTGALESASRTSHTTRGRGEGRMGSTDAIVQDVVQAARLIRRRPGFSAVIVLVLALGIGANTAVFSVVEGALLRAVPLPEAAQLVRVSALVPEHGRSGASLPGFQDWELQRGPFVRLGGFHTTAHSLVLDGSPQRLQVGRTVGDLFGTAGIQAALGRLYQPSEPGASGSVLLLTDEFWRSAFGGDASVVGRTVELDGESALVLGVLPPEETFVRLGAEIHAWAPMEEPLPWMGRGTGFLTVLGRLEPHLSVETAADPVLALADGLKGAGVTENGIVISGLRDELVGDTRLLLWALQGAALLLMVVVAVNAANLLLARSVDRTGEFAVRTALGAGGWRIARQVLIETTLLAMIGGIVGLALALAGREMVLDLVPDLARLTSSNPLNWTVLAWTLGTALGIGIVAGLWPALRASGRSWASMRMAAGRGSGGGNQAGRRGMVVVEVGLALVLVVGAGLMVRTVATLMDQELGFEARSVLTARLTLPETRYGEWADRHLFWDELSRRLHGLPGVEAVGLTGELPLAATPDGGGFSIEGLEWSGAGGPSIDKKTASPGYFEAMRIPVLQGRGFWPQDRMDSPRVTVITESFAERFFPGESPLGRKIRLGWWGDEFVEVVGVVGDVKQRGADQGAELASYLPLAQVGAPSVTVAVRTDEPPYLMAGAIRATVSDLDPGLPIYDVRSMEELLTTSLAQRTSLTSLLVGLSVIALIISCLGVFAVSAQVVRGRRQEIGIRMALGASGESVLRAVVLSELRVVALGLLFGLAATALLTRSMETLLFGVTALDPLTLALSSSLLGVVALIAVLGPALRAARTDPAGSLTVSD